MIIMRKQNFAGLLAVAAALAISMQPVAASSSSTVESMAEQAGSSSSASSVESVETIPVSLAEEPLSSGKILIDGTLYQLGETYTEIHERDWTLNDEDYEKYEKYMLNPRTASGSGISLYSDRYGRELGSFAIVIAQENPSEDLISMFDGIIDYIALPRLNREEPVPSFELPGGLTAESTLDDFKAAYGEPTYEYQDEGTSFESYDFSDGDVKLSAQWVDGKLNEIDIRD